MIVYELFTSGRHVFGAERSQVARGFHGLVESLFYVQRSVEWSARRSIARRVRDWLVRQ